MLFLFALLMAAAPVAASPEPVVADCEAHQFQTIVHVTVDGKPRSSKVKLCGKTGQSDAEWLHTLKDAIDKVGANVGMSAEAREQVVAALNVEIARLTPVVDASPPPPTTFALTAPSSRPSPPSPSLLTPPTGGPVEYSALPPMPAPKPAVSAAIIAANPPPPVPTPRLTLRCLAANTVSAELPCDQLERDMYVIVRADEDIARGTSLRFMRRGDNRAEVALLQLRRGQSQRFALPPRVCQGVAGSQIEIQVVRAVGSSPQIVDTRGPYELRC
jgi:hypothetical protein